MSKRYTTKTGTPKNTAVSNLLVIGYGSLRWAGRLLKIKLHPHFYTCGTGLKLKLFWPGPALEGKLNNNNNGSSSNCKINVKIACRVWTKFYQIKVKRF